MAAGSPDRFPKHLQTLFTSGAIGGLDDGALLERFVAGRDEAAFEVLVARHGPMVLRVCRAALADPHDADDAFQAVFLVLVRRARGDPVACVGCELAVRRRVPRLGPREGRRDPAPQARAAGGPSGDRRPHRALDDEPLDPAHVLHEELARLPDRYREALVLCYFEGHTCDAAAARLRRPVGNDQSAALPGARNHEAQAPPPRCHPAGRPARRRRDSRRPPHPFPQELVDADRFVRRSIRGGAAAAAPPECSYWPKECSCRCCFKKSDSRRSRHGRSRGGHGAGRLGGVPSRGRTPGAEVESVKAAREPAVAAPGAGTPEEVFSQAIEALDRDRIEDFVGLMHPEAVKRLRAT